MTAKRPFNGDRFPIFAYVDEVLACLAIAACGAIAPHAYFLSDTEALNKWTRWVGVGALVVSPCVGIAVVLLVRPCATARLDAAWHSTILRACGTISGVAQYFGGPVPFCRSCGVGGRADQCVIFSQE